MLVPCEVSTFMVNEKNKTCERQGTISQKALNGGISYGVSY